MSLTITVLNATQDMLRLQGAASGEGGGTAMTQLQLVELCVPGPLKSMLNAPLFQAPAGAPVEGQASQPGVASWVNLAADARLSVYTSSIAGDIGPAYSFTTDSGVNNINFSTDGSGTCIFELNYRHSVNR